MEGRREGERLLVCVFERFPVVVPLPTLSTQKEVCVCVVGVECTVGLHCPTCAVFSHPYTGVQYMLAAEEDYSGGLEGGW